MVRPSGIVWVTADNAFRREYTFSDTINLISIVDITVAGGLASHSYADSAAAPLPVSFTPPPSDATADAVIGESFGTSYRLLPSVPARR